MAAYEGTYVGRIGHHHLDGWNTVTHEGDRYSLADVMGNLTRHDIGKLMYVDKGVLQVENDQQRDARLAAEAQEDVTLDSLRRDIMRWRRESIDLAHCGPFATTLHWAANEAEAAALLMMLTPFLEPAGTMTTDELRAALRGAVADPPPMGAGLAATLDKAHQATYERASKQAPGAT